MSKCIPGWRGIGLVTVLLVLGGVVALYFMRPKEPSYQGKTLTEWCYQYHRYSNAHSEEALAEFKPKVVEAHKAIRAIGTNGIPFLLQKLTTRESHMKKAVNGLLDRQSVISYRLRDAEWEHTYADAGFEALGEAGRPAWPALVRLLKDPNVQVRNSAAFILAQYLHEATDRALR